MAPHLFVMGDVGRFRDVEPGDVQPTVDSAVTQLSSVDGLTVTGTSRAPATFNYASGTIPDDSPAISDNVTSQIVSLGCFTQPPTETAMMTSLGGRVSIPLASRISANIGYSYSRISTATPLNVQSMASASATAPNGRGPAICAGLRGDTGHCIPTACSVRL